MSQIEYRMEPIEADENGCLRCALLKRLRELGQDGWRTSSAPLMNPPAYGMIPAPNSTTVLLEREIPDAEASRQKFAPGA